MLLVAGRSLSLSAGHSGVMYHPELLSELTPSGVRRTDYFK